MASRQLLWALAAAGVVAGGLGAYALRSADAPSRATPASRAQPSAGEGEEAASEGATLTGTAPATEAAASATASAPLPPGRTAPSASAGSTSHPVDPAQYAVESKTVEAARAALAANNPKKALEELDFYFKIPNARALREEATLLKIEALAKAGRRMEARALAYSTRDEPSFDPYRERVDALLDGGV